MRIPAEYTGKHKGCGGQVVFRPAARRRELLAGESVMLSAVCRTCGERITTRYSMRDGARPTARSLREAGAVASLVDHRAAAEATRARVRTRVELPLAAGAEHMTTSTWIVEAESTPASVRAASNGLELLDESRADGAHLSLVDLSSEAAPAPLDADTQEHLDAFVQRLAAARQRVRDVLDHELPDPGLWRERAEAPVEAALGPAVAGVESVAVAYEPGPVVAVAPEAMAIEAVAVEVEQVEAEYAPIVPQAEAMPVEAASLPNADGSEGPSVVLEPEAHVVAEPEVDLVVAVVPEPEPAPEPAFEHFAVGAIEHVVEPMAEAAPDLESDIGSLPSPTANPHDLPAPVVAEVETPAQPSIPAPIPMPASGAAPTPLPAPTGSAYPQLAAPLPAPSGPAYPTLPAPAEMQPSASSEIVVEPLPEPTGTRYDLPAPVSPMTSSQPPVPVPDDGYPRSSYAELAIASNEGRGFDWGAEDEPEPVGRAAAPRTEGSRGKVILLAVTMLIVMTVVYLGASKFIFAPETSDTGSQPATTESSTPADAAQGEAQIVQGKAPKPASDASAQQQAGGTPDAASGTRLKDGASDTDGTATSATDDPFAPKG